jgi:hypothetical protein
MYCMYWPRKALVLSQHHTESLGWRPAGPTQGNPQAGQVPRLIHVHHFCLYSLCGSAVYVVIHGLAHVCLSPKNVKGILLQF